MTKKKRVRRYVLGEGNILFPSLSNGLPIRIGMRNSNGDVFYDIKLQDKKGKLIFETSE